MARSETASRRPLLAAVVLLGAAAAALAGSAATVWLRPSFDTPFRGQVFVAITGGEWEPALVPLALLALAGIPGVLATGGWIRRAVGAVLAAAGAWALFLGARPQLGMPADRGQLAAVDGAPSGGRLSDVVVIEPWSLLASLGGLLLLAAGLLLVLRASAMSRLGTRYSAPATQRREPDPDRRLWDTLDGGDDPT